MRQVEKRPVGAISVWTIVQILSILVWVGGFVIAFYYLRWKAGAGATERQNGQIFGMILTGFAYLAIIFSMIKHSPDRES